LIHSRSPSIISSCERRTRRRILDSNVVAFRKALDLTKIRHEGGIASDEDVAQAETQLNTTIAQDTDLGSSARSSSTPSRR